MTGRRRRSPIGYRATYVCVDAGIRYTVPAGYTPIEKTVNPETPTSYANYRMSTWNDEIGFMIESVPGFIPAEITSIADIRDYCAKRDSSYYDKEIIAPTQLVTVGGREMLCSEGRSEEYPAQIYTAYDLMNGQTLISVLFFYDESAYGKPRPAYGSRNCSEDSICSKYNNRKRQPLPNNTKDGLRPFFFQNSVGAGTGRQGASGRRLTTSRPRHKARRTV